MGSERGASMPSRTVWPRISMISTITSSPSITRSPARRVILSIGRSRGVGGRRGREQRGPQRTAARLVDHLVAATLPDQDRRLEVGGERLELLGGAHGDVDRHRGDVVKPKPLGFLVVQL